MNSIRVLLTDVCNMNCSNCINNKFRTSSSYMDTKRFIRIAEYFKNNNVRRIRIMGGEPTLHPDFSLFVKEAQQRFERVTVFTNGTNSSLKDFFPRDEDAVNYNSKFISNLNSDQIILQGKGSRVLSIVIEDALMVSTIKQQIDRLLTIWPKLKVSLTFDCTANIFSNRFFFLNKFNDIYQHCIDRNIETIVDHALPICFLYGTSVPIQFKSCICNINCAGLIDAQFNFRFCNQISKEKLPLFKGDKIVPFEIVGNFLQMNFYDKQLTALRKICKNCTLYGQFCNGGCYIQNPLISTSDILKNTELPTISKKLNYDCKQI